MLRSDRFISVVGASLVGILAAHLSAQSEYRYDDGSGEYTLGYAYPTDLAWLNWFQVQPGHETITSLRVAFSGMPDGLPFSIHVWADPAGFEDLFGAYLLSGGSGVTVSGTNRWVVVDIPDVTVSRAFWVGVIFHLDPADYGPALLDTSAPNYHHSWIMYGEPIKPDDLFSGGAYPYHIETVISRSGDWLIRADTTPPCTADFNADGTVNTLDVLAFLNAWGAGDPRGDFNGDGSINTLDVLAFLNAWSAGC